MAFTGRSSDYGYTSKRYEDDAPDFRKLATKISFIILRVLGSTVLGLMSAAIVAAIPLVVASFFVNDSTLGVIYGVGAMICWPIMALVIWFTLFQLDKDL